MENKGDNVDKYKEHKQRGVQMTGLTGNLKTKHHKGIIISCKALGER